MCMSSLEHSRNVRTINVISIYASWNLVAYSEFKNLGTRQKLLETTKLPTTFSPIVSFLHICSFFPELLILSRTASYLQNRLFSPAVFILSRAAHSILRCSISLELLQVSIECCYYYSKHSLFYLQYSINQALTARFFTVNFPWIVMKAEIITLAQKVRALI